MPPSRPGTVAIAAAEAAALYNGAPSRSGRSWCTPWSSTATMRCCLLVVALMGTLLAVTRTSTASRVHLHAQIRAGRSLRRGLLPTGSLTEIGELPAHVWHPGKTRKRSGLMVDAPEQGAYFAMCLAVKDQHADIREWIVHHASIGAEKFYIFDNNSTSPMLPVIADMVDMGLVEYHFLTEVPEKRKPQLYIYDTCLQEFGPRHRWMSFIDADEFFVLRNSELASMPSLLQQYEEYGALVVNWQMFGSSGLLERPENGTLASYYRCFPQHHKENLHVKTIANVQYTLGTQGDPHHFRFHEGYYAVNENAERVEGPRTKTVSIDQVALYHYATKSLAEYQGKIQRGSAMGNQKTIHFFHFIEEAASHNCTDALRLG